MFYVVDAGNRVLEVDSDWDEFLLRNGGAPHAASDGVLGRSLESFMIGDATKMFVRASLDAVRRSGQERSLPYRCDSPTERRQFEMRISPHANGQVKVEHRLIDASAHEPGRRSGGVSARAGWRCSQCLAVRHVGSQRWIGANVAPPGAPLAQDVCPGCVGRLFA